MCISAANQWKQTSVWNITVDQSRRRHSLKDSHNPCKIFRNFHRLHWKSLNPEHKCFLLCGNVIRPISVLIGRDGFSQLLIGFGFVVQWPFVLSWNWNLKSVSSTPVQFQYSGCVLTLQVFLYFGACWMFTRKNTRRTISWKNDALWYSPFPDPQFNIQSNCNLIKGYGIKLWGSYQDPAQQDTKGNKGKERNRKLMNRLMGIVHSLRPRCSRKRLLPLSLWSSCKGERRVHRRGRQLFEQFNCMEEAGETSTALPHNLRPQIEIPCAWSIDL